jgi:non-canonical purine NTP pyrophosphatase (RdgB/HAM1 family)
VTGRMFKFSELTFVSESSNKHLEYEKLLGISGLRWSKRALAEPQNVSITEQALQKLNFLVPQMEAIPFFAEHSGLVIDAWSRLPGGLTRVFLDNVGNDGICKMMSGYQREDRRASAIVVIGFHLPGGEDRTFEGRKRGRIADEPVGSLNFGWDPIFIPDGQPRDEQRTYAQMILDEKNDLSMRRAAANAFFAGLTETGRFEL